MPKHQKIIDHTGEKYHHLTAIEYTGKQGKDWRRIWLWLCNCGNYKELPVNSVIGGNTKSCGCLQGEYKGTQALGREIWKSRYSDGDLTFEEFLMLSQQNCYYCGESPSNRKKHRNPDFCEPFIYNGLDRVDNNEKHNRDNVVPCCWRCNEWKADFSLEWFLQKAETIYLFELERRKIAQQKIIKKQWQKTMKLAEKMGPEYFCPIWE